MRKSKSSCFYFLFVFLKALGSTSKGASVLLGMQLTALFKDYYSYPTKTSITVNYGHVPFPAVTLCNVNPLKRSNLWKFPDLHATILDSGTNTQSAPGGTPGDGSGNSAPGGTPGDGSNNSDPGGTPQGGSNNSSRTDDGSRTNSSLPRRPRSTRDRSGLTSGQTSSRTEYDDWKLNALVILRKSDQSIRLTSDQDMNEFIIKAAFNGFVVPNSNIQLMLTPEFGKCFTIDVNDVSDTAGPQDGLQLLLFLNREEYVKEIVSGYGVKVVLHEPNKFPIPDDEGHLLNPGYETNIALTFKTIERQGAPYGDCVESEEFLNKHRLNYTIPICYAVCLREKTWESCGCIPFRSPEKINDGIGRTICRSTNLCASDVKKSVRDNPESCDCRSRCSDASYLTSISSRKWPHPEYLQEQVYGDACAMDIAALTSTCTDLQQKRLNFTEENYVSYAENFLSVNIFYESLAFETMSEEPLYSTIGFLSDIGGSMGFFMGASLITYLELLHVLAELVVYAYTSLKLFKRWRPTLTPVVPYKDEHDVEMGTTAS